MMGTFTPEYHIRIPWEKSCEPRVKLPELCGGLPRPERCLSFRGRRSERMSFGMVFFHAAVGFGKDARAQIRVLLSDDRVDRDLRILADPMVAQVSLRHLIQTIQMLPHRLPNDVGRSIRRLLRQRFNTCELFGCKSNRTVTE
ncbi:hypothetical protein ASG37_16675 [Sphingomonas sp. Leaf407]|nr:hypothetical protein ASE97_16665 [Sphingomonas sp. Leaf42]KQT25061.1 hypothetical protein ASG37_16675 [Sphingomonas sp. Leaf407]